MSEHEKQGKPEPHHDPLVVHIHDRDVEAANAVEAFLKKMDPPPSVAKSQSAEGFREWAKTAVRWATRFILITDQIGVLPGGIAHELREKYPHAMTILHSGAFTSQRIGELIRDDTIVTFLPKGYQGIARVVDSCSRGLTLQPYLRYCQWINEPFTPKGLSVSKTPYEFQMEVMRGSAVGEAFTRYWELPLLQGLRTFIEDPARTPNPDAPFLLGDTAGADGKPLWLNTWDVYWEVVRDSPLGQQFGEAWEELFLNSAPPSS